MNKDYKANEMTKKKSIAFECAEDISKLPKEKQKEIKYMVRGALLLLNKEEKVS